MGKYEFKELTQGDLEAYATGLESQGVGTGNVILIEGSIIRAALHAGWLISPNLSVDDVPNMKPLDAKELATAIADLYQEVRGIDPN